MTDKGQNTVGVVLTAAHAAVALVASCKLVGIRPTDAFQGNTRASRARRIAAAGCVSRLGVPAREAANLFRIQAIRLAPTKLRDANITTEDLLEVAEALERNGLTAGDDPLARFRSINPPSPKAAKPKRTPRPDAPLPRIVSVTPRPSPAASRTPASAKRAAQAAPVRRIGPAKEPTPARAVTRMKPITDRIVGWTLQHVRRGVEVGFMAELFDVDPDQLQRLVSPGRAIAA